MEETVAIFNIWKIWNIFSQFLKDEDTAGFVKANYELYTQCSNILDTCQEVLDITLK